MHHADEATQRTAAEKRGLADLITLMRDTYPDVPPDEIEATVHGRYARFEDSRVREFVVLLVERHVRDQLRDRSAQPTT